MASTIDVMVVYTAAARQGAGGTTAMNSLVDLGVTQSEHRLSEQGITQRIRLVNKGRVSYTETCPGATLKPRDRSPIA